MECSRLLYKTLALSENLDPQESMHDEELLSMASNILVQVLQACCSLKKFELCYYLALSCNVMVAFIHALQGSRVEVELDLARREPWPQVLTSPSGSSMLLLYLLWPPTPHVWLAMI
jgi:hypothetical protein